MHTSPPQRGEPALVFPSTSKGRAHAHRQRTHLTHTHTHRTFWQWQIGNGCGKSTACMDLVQQPYTHTHTSTTLGACMHKCNTHAHTLTHLNHVWRALQVGELVGARMPGQHDPHVWPGRLVAQDDQLHLLQAVVCAGGQAAVLSGQG